MVEKLKRRLSDKNVRIIVLVAATVIIFFYYKAFFTVGVHFNDTFLKKEVVSEETHYKGKSKYGSIEIIVKGKGDDEKKSMTEVSYYLPNNINKSFSVYHNYKDQWLLGSVEIKDEGGNTLFDGRYRRGSLFLYDSNNEPLIQGSFGFYNDTPKVTYDSSYEVPLKSVVEFSLFEKEGIRGNVEIMIYAVILIILTAIDIKSPLMFFTLSHAIHVKDPEPTDLYIAMQQVSWVVIPAIALILLTVAI